MLRQRKSASQLLKSSLRRDVERVSQQIIYNSGFVKYIIPIVFYTDTDGNYEIYTMNIDGSNQTRLTNNPAIDYAPHYSPDGSKIIFASQRDGNEEIYTMNADGTNQTRATTNAATDTEPSWQPVRFSTSTNTSSTNGKIAFTSSRTGNNEIFTMNADGSNQINISNNAASDVQAAWSPDGSKIAFQSDRTGNSNIYTMNADGSSQTRITNNTFTDEFPSWSPDGTKIVFTSNRTGQGDIYRMNADGTNQIQLTNYFVLDSDPEFSPDGSRIVFSRVSYENGFGRIDIYVMNSNGTNETRLTNSAAFVGNQQPAFSPDGSKIAFHSNLNSPNADIFVMNADGTNPVNLTQPNDGSFPVWSPDGTKIAFTSLRDVNDREIYVMNTNGTNLTRLTNSVGLDSASSWQRGIGGAATVAPASNVSVTFANVSQAGNTVATPIAPASAGALPSGYQLIPQSIAYDIRTSAQFSGNITTTFNVPNVPDALTCTSLRMLHYNAAINRLENVTTGTNSYNSTTQVCTVSGVTTSLSPFVIAQELAPSAATVSVGGRISAANGNGIRNVRVTLTDASGNTRTAKSSSFGYYRFDEVAVGETYTISVAAKRFTFNQPTQILTVQEDLSEVDFVANE